MKLVRTCALAATFSAGFAGGVKAADFLPEPDRYETAQPVGPREYQERDYQREDYRSRTRRADREGEFLVPPRRIDDDGEGFHRDEYRGRRERRFTEERVIVEGPRWHRPVVQRPIFDRDDDDDCRIVVRRRVDAFGDVVLRRLRVCELD